MIARLLLSSFLSLGVSFVSFGECLRLQNALETGTRNSPLISIANAEYDAALAAGETAGALWRPRVEVFSRNALGETGLTSAQIQNQVGLSFAQRLYDFGNAKRSVEIARNDIRLTTENLFSVKGNTGLEIGLLFVERERARAALEVFAESASFYELQLDLLQELLTSSLATKSELIEVEVNLARVNAETARQELILREIEVQLATYYSETVEICDLSEALSSLSQRLPNDADALVVAALEGNFDIKRERFSVENKRLSAIQESNARFPVISARGIVAYASEGGFQDWRYRDQIGIDVSVPLYAGNEIAARKRTAFAELSRSEAELSKLENDITEEARSLKWQAVLLDGQINALASAVLKLNEQLDVVEEEIRNGTSTFTRLVDVREEYEVSILQLETVRLQKRAGVLRQAYLAGILSNND